LILPLFYGLIAVGQGCRTVRRWAEPVFFPVLTFFPAGAGRSRNMLSVQNPIRYENPSITEHPGGIRQCSIFEQYIL
jgi:hypothetical protein